MTEQGDYREFTKDTATVIWGDCLAVLRHRVPSESVDLIFADPPYNIGKKFADFRDSWPSDQEYASWCQEWLKAEWNHGVLP